MLEPVEVRAATAGDIPRLAETAAASYHDAFKLLLAETALTKRDRAYFERRFRENLDKLSVAGRSGEIDGFTMMTAHNIDMFFVAPAAQGTGVGRAMIEHAEARGAKTLECFAGNAPARAFYERHGWTLDQSYARDYEGSAMSFVTYVRL